MWQASGQEDTPPETRAMTERGESGRICNRLLFARKPAPTAKYRWLGVRGRWLPEGQEVAAQASLPDGRGRRNRGHVRRIGSRR